MNIIKTGEFSIMPISIELTKNSPIINLNSNKIYNNNLNQNSMGVSYLEELKNFFKSDKFYYKYSKI